MLPELRTDIGFIALREAGYDLAEFSGPKNYRTQAEILDVALKIPGINRDIAYFVLDSLLAVPKGFDFFSRFPKEEVAQFCRLAIESCSSGRKIPIVAPVCPDYRGHYQLFDGVDDTAEKVITNLLTLKGFFGKRNLPFYIQIHIADVEAFEPLILQASGETIESFLKKTTGSIMATQEKICQLGLEGIIKCGSMLEVFNQSGLNYFSLKEVNIREILEHEGGKIRKTIEALAAERRRLNDFDLVDLGKQKLMVAEELADYATYGDLVNGQAVILSPDAMSAIPAYNFLRGRQKLFNPTIYLKNVKMSS